MALLNLGFAAGIAPKTEFHRDIRPILEKYCFDCHADGANKGNVAFDEFKSDQGFARQSRALVARLEKPCAPA